MRIYKQVGFNKSIPSKSKNTFSLAKGRNQVHRNIHTTPIAHPNAIHKSFVSNSICKLEQPTFNGFRTHVQLRSFGRKKRSRAIRIAQQDDNEPSEVISKAHGTPAMRQYKFFKAQHPDFLLMFRLGDFYEMFFEDAIVASSALDITLTKRGVGEGADIPMCGIPSQSLDNYVEKLIKKGIMVAVCDQVPGDKRPGEPIMRREITRLVTPGTVTEDRFLHPRKSNYLLSIIPSSSKFLGIAWVDVSTGEFHMSISSKQNLRTDLCRISPSELVVPEELTRDPALKGVLNEYHITVQPLDPSTHDPTYRLRQLYKVSRVEELGGFSPLELRAGDAILKYLEKTYLDNLPHLALPQTFSGRKAMSIDPATRRSLEITSTFAGEKKDSLLSIIDRTVTGPGARLLLSHLNAPLLSVPEIEMRLDAVEFFVKRKTLIEDVREILRSTYDMKRSLQRLYIGKGGPRDISAIGATLSQLQDMKRMFQAEGELPILIQNYIDNFSSHTKLINTLAAAMVDEPPHSISEGGFINHGYNEELDKLRALKEDKQQMINDLQAKYRTMTGIQNLKINSNHMIGYYIEVQLQHKAKVPDYFIHYQTTTREMRFKTKELQEMEVKMHTASELSIQLEHRIFNELVNEIYKHGESINNAATALAGVDVSSSLALLALERNYTKPRVTDGIEYDVVGGRHPTVEAIQGDQGGAFVSNDCLLNDEKRVWLITGPNMGGKSTFLRQTAIIAILAQMGSYVPAERATIGVVDAIFSRIGAADDLVHDRSTFMVEMVETANILFNATHKSLVIMDEVGRGTSTYDGMSIAWAVIEYLYHHNKCRTLFATHYHELTELEKHLPKLCCKTMAVKETEGHVIFVYKVVSGASGQSYGIHVAELAGIPPSVTKRASELLVSLLKNSHLSTETIAPLSSESNFTQSKETEELRSKGVATYKTLENALKTVDVSSISPTDAVKFLRDLKTLIYPITDDSSESKSSTTPELIPRPPKRESKPYIPPSIYQTFKPIGNVRPWTPGFKAKQHNNSPSKEQSDKLKMEST